MRLPGGILSADSAALHPAYEWDRPGQGQKGVHHHDALAFG